MDNDKNLLLRAFADLTRTKALYGQLTTQITDSSLRIRLCDIQQRVQQDLDWVSGVLQRNFGVDP